VADLGVAGHVRRGGLDERDHLFVLAGHHAPQRTLRADHVNPGMLRILDRLDDTPAQIITALGETLVQTRLAVALLGDQTGFTGPARSLVYRWFTDPGSRSIYRLHGRVFTAQLRVVAAREGRGSRAAGLADRLLELSPGFAALWTDHEIGVRYRSHHAAVPDAARPGPVPVATGLHRHARHRGPRESPAPLGHRRPAPEYLSARVLLVLPRTAPMSCGPSGGLYEEATSRGR
jgi:hypothetical protein